MGIFRDSFSVMISLSLLVHAGVVAWLGFSSATAPEVIPPQRGRCSIALQAMAVRAEPTKEKEKAKPVELARALRDLPRLPQMPELPAIPTDFKVPLRELVKALPVPEKKKEDEKKETTKPEETVAPEGPRPSPSSRAMQGAEVDEVPTAVFNPNPRYPPDALAAGLEGRVVVLIKIGADGRVTAASVYESSGLDSFDEAALEAIRRWRYRPARRGGLAVPYEGWHAFRFKDTTPR